MDQGIKAIWYDLPAEDADEYLRWLHQVYLPAIVQLPGRLWAAHYKVTGGGASLYGDAADRFARAEGAEVGGGKDYLLLVGAGSPHAFFKPVRAETEIEEDAQTRKMKARWIGARPCVFAEEARINGPEYDQKVPSGTPGPAIQMGSLRTKTVADEFDLAAWYAQYRFPAMARMPGCIATRKLLSVAGWAKHAVLYEFTSLEARREHFQRHESLGLDKTVWTHKIINYTIHAPGSPSVGQRIWPES
jgi:hypothetical protein